MQSALDIGRVAADLLSNVNLTLSSCTTLQSLWAGYGSICRVKAIPTTKEHNDVCTTAEKPQSFILKYIAPPIEAHAATTRPNEGHIRKILSYQVEQYFYTTLAPKLPSDIPVASCITNIDPSTIDETNSTGTAMLLTDLRESFPQAGEKRSQLTQTQTLSSLTWLANFHGFWWSNIGTIDRNTCILPPLEHYSKHKSTNILNDPGIWLNGGYTYLVTRQTEYISLQDDSDSEWSTLLTKTSTSDGPSIAEKVALFLSPSTEQSALQPYLTLLHGDVKSENLFTTTDGKSVAFYDFQYVGLGCGASDLAKFFTCSVPISMLVDQVEDVYAATELEMQSGEKKLLENYLELIRERSGKGYEWDVFIRHWEAALVDWLRFQASWGFWGNTEWLETRVRSIVKDNGWRDWLGMAIRKH